MYCFFNGSFVKLNLFSKATLKFSKMNVVPLVNKHYQNGVTQAATHLPLVKWRDL